MAIEQWKRHPGGGGLAVNPIVGFETAAMADGMAGMVRLEFALDPTMKRTDAVQLVATAKQIEDLILALRNLADNLAFNVSADVPPGRLS